MEAFFAFVRLYIESCVGSYVYERVVGVRRVYDTIFFREATMLTDFDSFRGRKRNLWLAGLLRLKIGDVGIFFGPAKAILYH